MFFLDEMGVNLAMTRTHARVKGGGRAYDAVAPAGKNISVVSAIGLEGVVAYQAVYGSLDSLGFEAFLANRLLPKLQRGDCLVLDNCSIHKTDDIRKLCRKAGVALLFLPPYSPDFNPIENMWSKLKAGLRALKARRLIPCWSRRSNRCLPPSLTLTYSTGVPTAATVTHNF